MSVVSYLCLCPSFLCLLCCSLCFVWICISMILVFNRFPINEKGHIHNLSISNWLCFFLLCRCLCYSCCRPCSSCCFHAVNRIDCWVNEFTRNCIFAWSCPGSRLNLCSIPSYSCGPSPIDSRQSLSSTFQYMAISLDLNCR